MTILQEDFMLFPALLWGVQEIGVVSLVFLILRVEALDVGHLTKGRQEAGIRKQGSSCKIHDHNCSRLLG